MGILVFFVILFSTSSVTEVKEVAKVAKTAAKDAAHHLKSDKLPLIHHIHNPFRQVVHEPPAVQRNSTSGDTKWYSDWQWLHAFSSSITLDEDRSVLPPLSPRPPIYTYYDPDSEKDAAVKEEEKKLLHIWRRAWWAQGFKPIILGRAEAMRNPHYETMQGKKMNPALEAEMMRWLAWGHMGTGILANWLAVPMGPRNDHDLEYLRRGEYPKLTRYESLAAGVFSGTQDAVSAVIASVLQSSDLTDSKTVQEATAANPDTFSVDPKPSGIAFYAPSVLTAIYKPVAEELLKSEARGLAQLAQLITFHLHSTFLSNYPIGLSVLNTEGDATAMTSAPAVTLAESLRICPSSPLPSSCPPNKPKCTRCEPARVGYPQMLVNSTNVFTIGTIPHPYTLQSLWLRNAQLTVAHIRRNTDRDIWLDKATEDILPPRISAYARIVAFKDDVAGDRGAARGIWHTAEQQLSWRDLELHFGFELPGSANDSALRTPVPTLDEEPPVLQPLIREMKHRPAREVLVKQAEVFAAAREVIEGKRRAELDVRRAVEAWNMADTEAWRFVRALEARKRVERGKWEEEESRYKGQW